MAWIKTSDMVCAEIHVGFASNHIQTLWVGYIIYSEPKYLRVKQHLFKRPVHYNHPAAVLTGLYWARTASIGEFCRGIHHALSGWGHQKIQLMGHFDTFCRINTIRWSNLWFPVFFPTNPMILNGLWMTGPQTDQFGAQKNHRGSCCGGGRSSAIGRVDLTADHLWRGRKTGTQTVVRLDHQLNMGETG